MSCNSNSFDACYSDVVRVCDVIQSLKCNKVLILNNNELIIYY